MNRLATHLAEAAGESETYVHNTIFHHMVDTLAAMLPSMVAGMAETAKYQEARRVRLMEDLMGKHFAMHFSRDIDGLIIEPGSDPLA